LPEVIAAPAGVVGTSTGEVGARERVAREADDGDGRRGSERAGSSGPSARPPIRGATQDAVSDEPAEPSADDLLRRADAARRRGALVEATMLLERFVDGHPDHAEVDPARMSLARVLEQRGRFEQAARAYEALLGQRVIGTIREDARAAAARVWSRHGREDRARDHARTYLDRNPNGPHASVMKEIAKP
jgi:tetratricopeptide (TPR) repeat protein